MTTPKIGIILSSTRQGRFADKPAAWLQAVAAAARTDLTFELIDLRDYPLPFFDWPASAIRKPVDIPEAAPWRAKIAGCDGFIFITAEYNHSIPAVLKNAIDHLHAEWVRKPAAFVGYGNAGGARAVEHLRAICIEIAMAPVRAAVVIGREPLVGVLTGGRSLSEFDYLEVAAKAMLDDLAWWTTTLKAGRERA